MTQYSILNEDYSFDASNITGDFLETANDDPYYNKSITAQQTRVDEYIEGSIKLCTKLNNGHYGKVHKSVSFSDIRLLNLDREFKIQLFKRLSETSIDGNLIKVAFPTTECDYDITLSW